VGANTTRAGGEKKKGVGQKRTFEEGVCGNEKVAGYLGWGQRRPNTDTGKGGAGLRNRGGLVRKTGSGVEPCKKGGGFSKRQAGSGCKASTDGKLKDGKAETRVGPATSLSERWWGGVQKGRAQRRAY